MAGFVHGVVHVFVRGATLSGFDFLRDVFLPGLSRNLCRFRAPESIKDSTKVATKVVDGSDSGLAV